MPARQIASVLGTLESCRPAIWQAPLHFRHLQIRMIQALHSSNQNFDVTITLDHDSLEELHWWVSNINSVNGSPIRPPAPTLFITTDASKTGWGAVCKSQRTNGHWSDSERTQHINVLELKAAFLALKSFLKNQSHKVVCLRMDNTTAVAHVNNKGSTHSPCLLTLALELWHWCLERNIMISAQYVPGKLNTIADSESRVFNDSSKWKIEPQTILLSRSSLEPLISLDLVGTKLYCFRARVHCYHCLYIIFSTNPVRRSEELRGGPNDFPLSQGVQNRPVCFSPIRPASPICQLASGPRGSPRGCVDDGLGTLQGLRLPTFQSDPSCPKQSVSGQSRHHISGTHLASTIMVATATEPPDRTSSPPAELQTPPEGPSRSSESSSNVPQTTLSRVSCLRGQYQAMGIPDNVTEILLSASRQSTRKTYQSAWRCWSGWCVKRKIDPLSAPLTDILLYLTEYFNSGAAYRSVNVACSAISTSHAKLNGLPVGQNLLVIQLLKGMFNNRPPKPRYSHTWEVSSVTTYLASLGSNRSLSLKQLSWKLAMLFSLT